MGQTFREGEGPSGDCNTLSVRNKNFISLTSRAMIGYYQKFTQFVIPTPVLIYAVVT